MNLVSLYLWATTLDRWYWNTCQKKSENIWNAKWLETLLKVLGRGRKVRWDWMGGGKSGKGRRVRREVKNQNNIWRFNHSFQPFRPTIPSNYSVKPLLPTIPSNHSFQPFRPTIPSNHSFQPFLPIIPSNHSFQPFPPTIPPNHFFQPFLPTIPSNHPFQPFFPTISRPFW